MAKETLYRQCELQNGTGRTVGYIEERGAKIGARVELVDRDNALWTVASVGDRPVTKAALRFAEGANKHASLAA